MPVVRLLLHVLSSSAGHCMYEKKIMNMVNTGYTVVIKWLFIKYLGVQTTNMHGQDRCALMLPISPLQLHFDANVPYDA